MEKKYGLKESPFKQKSSLWEEVPTWVDREKEMKAWNKILDDSVATPSANFIVLIVGDYGMGKSLSLFKINNEARERKRHFPIYLSLLGEQKPSKPGLDVMYRIFREVDFSKLKINKKELMYVNEIDSEVYKILRHILFGDKELKKLALSYIRGEISVTQSQLKALGVMRKMNDIDLAIDYLIGILFLIKQSGFSTFLITIDEFEYLFSLVPKSSQPIYLALLRRLYDLRTRIPQKLRDTTSNIALFLAISADGERRLKEMQDTEKTTGGPISPLRRRIAFNVITLTSLTQKASIELIEKRLSLNRTTGEFSENPLIPFTKEFAVFIHDISDGRPETIIDRCDNVLDVGLERRIPLLTKEFAIEVLQERGIDINTHS
jgi:hypothetical protein